ncbi:MAG: FAD-dependent oxidoreductase [Pirellulaceae bacterium]|nr:FAD-dependent oxidoreductase [Pirellulaceae bacterium]
MVCQRRRRANIQTVLPIVQESERWQLWRQEEHDQLRCDRRSFLSGIIGSSALGAANLPAEAQAGPRLVGPGETSEAAIRTEVLVVGKAVSATHLAQSAVRVQPIVSQMGQAAGTAAALAVAKNTTLRSIDISELEGSGVLTLVGRAESIREC